MEAQGRLAKRRGFTVVYRDVAQDKRLSLKTRGLFLLMQSLPDDWTFTVSGLAALAGCGKTVIRAALKELETVGYLVREQGHNDSGKFSGNTWILQESAPCSSLTPDTGSALIKNPEKLQKTPLSENRTTAGKTTAPLSENRTTVDPQNAPLSGFPSTEKPTTENRTLQNNIYNIIPPIAPQGAGNPVSEKGVSRENTGVTAPETIPSDEIEKGAENTDAVKKPESKKRSRKSNTAKSEPDWKPERFNGLWRFYPVEGRKSKQAAIRAWEKLQPDDTLIAQIGRALQAQKATDDWRRGFAIPYLSTYLNQRRWEDVDAVPDAGQAPQRKDGWGV